MVLYMVDMGKILFWTPGANYAWTRARLKRARSF